MRIDMYCFAPLRHAASALVVGLALLSSAGVASAQSQWGLWTGDYRAQAEEERPGALDLGLELGDEGSAEDLQDRSDATNLLPWENTKYSCYGSCTGALDPARTVRTFSWDFTSFSGVGTSTEKDGGFYTVTYSDGAVATGKFVFAKPVPISNGTSWEYTHPKSPTGQCKDTRVVEYVTWKPKGATQICEYLVSDVSLYSCTAESLHTLRLSKSELLGCETIEP